MGRVIQVMPSPDTSPVRIKSPDYTGSTGSAGSRQTAIENAEALPTLLTGSVSRQSMVPPIKEETSFILKVSSSDRHDMSSKVNCEAINNKESSYPMLESF